MLVSSCHSYSPLSHSSAKGKYFSPLTQIACLFLAPSRIFVCLFQTEEEMTDR